MNKFNYRLISRYKLDRKETNKFKKLIMLLLITVQFQGPKLQLILLRKEKQEIN